MIYPQDALIALIIYRVVSMLVGAGFGWMGYRLLRAGLYEMPTEVVAEWGKRKFVMRQAAPGTIFALFGAVIVAISLVKGVSISGQSAAATAGPSDWSIVTQPGGEGDAHLVVPRIEFDTIGAFQ